MLITCPSCSKRYNVSDEKLTGGRMLRCVGCGNVWWEPGILNLTQEEEEKETSVALSKTQSSSMPSPEPSRTFFQKLLYNYHIDWILLGLAMILVIIVLWSERGTVIDRLPHVGSTYYRAGTNLFQ